MLYSYFGNDLYDRQDYSSDFFSGISDLRRNYASEKYAMKKAEEELSNLGFRSFDNTSDKKCYDYTCKRNGTLYYVEVKGTQGAGTSVILTKNEVEHSTQHAQISIAVIVHGVKVDRERRKLHRQGAYVFSFLGRLKRQRFRRFNIGGLCRKLAEGREGARIIMSGKRLGCGNKGSATTE